MTGDAEDWDGPSISWYPGSSAFRAKDVAIICVVCDTILNPETWVDIEDLLTALENHRHDK